MLEGFLKIHNSKLSYTSRFSHTLSHQVFSICCAAYNTVFLCVLFQLFDISILPLFRPETSQSRLRPPQRMLITPSVSNSRRVSKL